MKLKGHSFCEKIINYCEINNKDQLSKYFKTFVVNKKKDDNKLFNFDKKDIDKSVIDVYISLFFEINKKISNFRLYDLDSLQTLNTIRYIFIKHSENLNK